MKTYNKAELQIVRMNNNDIVTTSTPTLGGNYSGGAVLTPERRKSIWD